MDAMMDAMVWRSGESMGDGDGRLQVDFKLYIWAT